MHFRDLLRPSIPNWSAQCKRILSQRHAPLCQHALKKGQTPKPLRGELWAYVLGSHNFFNVSLINKIFIHFKCLFKCFVDWRIYHIGKNYGIPFWWLILSWTNLFSKMYNSQPQMMINILFLKIYYIRFALESLFGIIIWNLLKEGVLRALSFIRRLCCVFPVIRKSINRFNKILQILRNPSSTKDHHLESFHFMVSACSVWSYVHILFEKIDLMDVKLYDIRILFCGLTAAHISI